MPAKEKLVIVKGNPMKPTDVEAAFNDSHRLPDAVVVALSSVRTSDNPFAKTVSPPLMMAKSNANLMTSMRNHGVRKIVHMQALGVGESFPNLFFVMRHLVRKSNMALSYEDHDQVTKDIIATDLDYVLVRPTRLAEGEALPVKVDEKNGENVGSFSSITRASVAKFLVDAAGSKEWDRTAPVLSN